MRLIQSNGAEKNRSGTVSTVRIFFGERIEEGQNHGFYRLRYVAKVNKGVSLLIAIILLGSALLIISSGALIIGLSRQEGEYAASRGGETRGLADGCMNETFLRIRRDASWGLSGAQPFTAPNGSCTIQVNDIGNGSRTIDVFAQVAEYRSHIRATYSATTTPPSISAWEERSD